MVSPGSPSGSTSTRAPALPPDPDDDGPAHDATDGLSASLVPPDLASLQAAQDEKRHLLDQAAEAVVGQLDGAALPAGVAAAEVPALMHRFYGGEPAAEVVDHEPAELARLALDHLALAAVRPQGSALVDVSRAGSRPVVRVVTDDMPFLVDSVTAEIVRQGITLDHVVHPVVVVRRDLAGRLLAFCDSGDPATCGSDALAESWMVVVLDAPLDEEAATDLVAGLRTVLGDVRGVHEDGAKLRARAAELADRLEALPPGEDADAAAGAREGAALLRWLTEGNFVFLGARDVDVTTAADGATTVTAVPGSGLGVLRSDDDGQRVVPPSTAAAEHGPLLVTKGDARATVHRPAWLDVVAVRLPTPEGAVRQHRLVGLFPAAGLTGSVREVPVLRRTVAAVLDRSGVPADSHSGKELLDVLESYPSDELLQVDADELLPVSLAVLHLRERRQTRLFLRRDPFGRFFSALVYLPRDRYTTDVRLAMQQLLLERLGGTSIEYTARSTESVLTRLHFVVRVPVDRRGGTTLPDVDVPALEAALAAAARSWTDDLADALAARHGAEAERRLARVADAFPAAYQEDFPATTAVEDLARLDALAPGEIALKLQAPGTAEPGERRLTVYRVGERLLLSDVLPVLQHMGVDVVDERPYEIDRIGAPLAWVYDFGLTATSTGIDPPAAHTLATRFTEAVAAVWRGDAEDDGLGALVLAAGLDWRQVAVVRGYVQWLRQGGLPFGQSYVEESLAAHPQVVAALLELFRVRFDPDLLGDRARRETRLADVLRERIAAVDSLDQDRVLSALFAAVCATQRTSAYTTGAFAGGAPLVLKLDPHAVPDLPEPRPAREIWVSSPRVMGVHLRFGAVARGGLRWSDRREDLRTEVLGLVKAQTVKNTVIVPTGAKGGFVPLRPTPEGATRDEVLAEGQACYRIFINALLSLTDDLRDGEVVPPERVVRHDGDDTYLVVAADKGTATFSDLANSVALERAFWLGDAFASGGSVGYDHKAMGITARGAWESVTRHFRELGVDTQSQEVTVVGVGDMSGDVFGNGMLLSEHLRLVAAFDHRHVFVDPDPHAATSFAERRRLFELPRSSWADYDSSLISAGGGVWPRTAKSVPISEPARRALGLDDGVDHLTPGELVRAVLLAPVDLLFNGGIGTYVKSSAQSHLDVGDKANDAVRVDGEQLRVRVVGEGGNLGLTQRGRVEYALAGGRVNTDAIDNSAGVDTSDHEVNIKIALDRVVRAGQLDAEGRVALLAEMSDDVAAGVLADNYDQNAALAAECSAARGLLDAHQRFIRALELSGRLDRAVEDLPDDRAIGERRRDGSALTGPELSVLLAYAKLEVADAVLHSTLPDDPALGPLLTSYFPAPLRRRFPDAVAAHPLRREIIATSITNRAVNVAGVTGLFRLAEETGAPLVTVVRAHAVARAVFDIDRMWDSARALDNRVPAAVQVQLRTEATRLAERAARWLLRVPELSAEPAPSLTGVTGRFAGPVAEVRAGLPDWLLGPDATAHAAREAEFRAAGVPADLAAEAATAPVLPVALDLAVVAERTGAPLAQAGQVMHRLGEHLQLVPLRELVIGLPRDRRWPSMARASLRDDLAAEQAALTADVLALRDGDDDGPVALVDGWVQRWDTTQRRAAAQLAELSNGDRHELAELVVAVRTLRGLRRRT
ncbi:NAD-glutamate dehydrogenase [Modestobacter sp. I12A-02628]|uniref:NAD-glutamate dehydrogenase n=1 Tax=Goekera deserti TaxID=2497753 RepID=A0A7K3WJA2_9ACTN|nr:NAD-glutamate dehydrogenase [Goekera deserti]MPR00549.1 NAD-glutamate dehydrogenase [Goekera deserti]NDI50485.1 NAD-glutamate dehydrogenase [Goekera deserti]NEL56581.1 NAD-glutamate dehydrogenase [Goekera deserti]